MERWCFGFGDEAVEQELDLGNPDHVLAGVGCSFEVAVEAAGALPTGGFGEFQPVLEYNLEIQHAVASAATIESQHLGADAAPLALMLAAKGALCFSPVECRVRLPSFVWSRS